MNGESTAERTMNESLPALEPSELESLLQLIQEVIGIPFPPERRGDLARHLREMTLTMGFKEQRDFVNWFLHEAPPAKRMDLLAKQLTIGETYFFRDEKNFQLLGKEILPALYQTDKEQITLWSAGCSSGEEPYTMAMTIDMAPFSGREVKIVASDINPVALGKAQAGQYTDWSFRNPPPGVQEKYFTRTGPNKVQIAKQIQQKVLFMHVNLVEERYPPPLDKPASIDVLFCRNVLMYFTQEKRDFIVNRFSMLLADDGWFFVSPSEAALIRHPALSIDRASEPNIFRKRVRSSPVHVVPPKVFHSQPPSPQVIRLKQEQVGKKDLPKRGTDSPSGMLAAAQQKEILERADRLFKDHRLTEAATLLTDYLAVKNRSVAREGDADLQTATLLLARIHANLGKLDQAEQGYRRAIALDRLRADHYYHLAIILLEKGDADGAVSLLGKALFLQPEMVVAHLQLASLSPDKKRAHRHARTVVELLAKDPPESIVPLSDGLTVSAITQMARQITGT
ncbi:MAG: hypothetical protein HQL80_13475 [Magnetococcales bacterium]|nr:hypothetical protein [Magnetococcales bacterium]